MKAVNIHEAKTHLSRLVEEAAGGEPFIIAKNGKGLVKVVPLNLSETMPPQRIGMLQGQYKIPDDFDAFAKEDIEKMFYGDE
jgi:prevent-host-death family protein